MSSKRGEDHATEYTSLLPVNNPIFISLENNNRQGKTTQFLIDPEPIITQFQQTNID
jgi:DNA polymerase IIIc chi subunit